VDLCHLAIRDGLERSFVREHVRWIDFAHVPVLESPDTRYLRLRQKPYRGERVSTDRLIRVTLRLFRSIAKQLAVDRYSVTLNRLSHPRSGSKR
jgi:hypothetical protein